MNSPDYSSWDNFFIELYLGTVVMEFALYVRKICCLLFPFLFLSFILHFLLSVSK